MRTASLITVLLLLACGDDLSTGPTERGISIEGTSAWSGGQYRVMVIHGAEEEPPLTVTLDGEALPVTRMDGATFSAQLPSRVGDFPLRVEGENLVPLEIVLTLHGFLSEINGPGVAGPVMARPGPPSFVLGATVDGAAEISLETGTLGATWSSAVHALECSNGIVPGPRAGTVLLRPRAAVGECLPYTIREYSSAGLASGTAQSIWQADGRGLSAIVGPSTFIVPRGDDYAFHYQCGPVHQWSTCGSGAISAPPTHHSVEGWLPGYEAGRILSLSVRAGLHDLASGAVITVLPAGAPGGQWIMGADFSASEDTLAIAVRDNTLSGYIALHESATGRLLVKVPVPDGVPLAVAFDSGSDRFLVPVYNGLSDKMWLRVLSADLDVEIDLPIEGSAFAENLPRYGYHSLLVDPIRSEAILVSTTRIEPGSQNVGVLAPMMIHRWSLIPE